MRQKLELAKADLKERASSAGKGAGMYASAGLAAHFVLLFLSLGSLFGVTLWVGYGWAAVVVAVIWAVIGGVLALVARREVYSVKGLPQTADTMKKIPPTFMPSEETPRAKRQMKFARRLNAPVAIWVPMWTHWPIRSAPQVSPTARARRSGSRCVE